MHHVVGDEGRVVETNLPMHINNNDGGNVAIMAARRKGASRRMTVGRQFLLLCVVVLFISVLTLRLCYIVRLRFLPWGLGASTFCVVQVPPGRRSRAYAQGLWSERFAPFLFREFVTVGSR